MNEIKLIKRGKIERLTIAISLVHGVSQEIDNGFIQNILSNCESSIFNCINLIDESEGGSNG